jgi:hypothetical protein
MDSIICSAAGLNSEYSQRINHHLSQGEKKRPGLPERSVGSDHIVLATDNGLYDRSRKATSGVILAVSEVMGVVVGWVDGLDIRVPICIPIELIPLDLRMPGKAFKAELSTEISDIRDVAIGSITPFSLADMTKEYIVKRITRALA